LIGAGEGHTMMGFEKKLRAKEASRSISNMAHANVVFRWLYNNKNNNNNN
jgi:hypothetical protein